MEYLDIVDNNDIVIWKSSRQEIYEKKLNHRIVHIMIFNKKWEYLAQVRSEKASFLPWYYSTSVWWHVSSWETYLEAAKREMKEEIGLDLDIYFKIKFIFKTENNIKKFIEVYEAIIDDEKIKINENEVKNMEFIDLEKLKQKEKLHPELKYILHNFYN